MLQLAENNRKSILAHAERAYPDECCGILLGSKSGECFHVRAVVACTNQALRKKTRYEIPPRDLLCAQKLARAAGHSIVGFYHSHPEHPAAPSRSDLNEALWTDSVYVIVSVRKARANDVRAYRCVLENGERCFAEERVGFAEAARVA